MTDTPEKIVYTATATAFGGRGGSVKTEDGIIDVALAAPKEMGGPGEAANPEALFAAGYASCFSGALGLVAKEHGVDAGKAKVEAAVGIGPEGRSFALAVSLDVTIPDVDQETAQKLADGAHQVCPYSKATRGNVEVTVTAHAG